MTDVLVPRQGPLIYTCADLADEAGVKLETIHRYRNSGSLPKEDGMAGRSPYWYPDTVIPWINARTGSQEDPQ